ncbi:hypothetical protein B0T25DRAFT_492749 [Lasiosphaeria hispida]|uniref:Uncharacterized protein n=1 Tax=Lasiosphaeria hispida TaxID=260671 RepID=A0AAJ0HWC4_9PEZI|nr:hypothetical protein B0T25DRAFT_492749 [Lasiosphaeria hispida]
MEQNLNCNVSKCGSQLTDHAQHFYGFSITDLYDSHALCLGCARNHGFTGQGPYACPVCQQPLTGSEIFNQLLQPSEEWKSVALLNN